MTEHRILSDLSEIRMVIFECDTCKTRLGFVPEEVAMLQQCPKGHTWDWNLTEGHQSVAMPAVAFLHALKSLRKAAGEKVGFRIFLEYDASPRAGLSL